PRGRDLEVRGDHQNDVAVALPKALELRVARPARQLQRLDLGEAGAKRQAVGVVRLVDDPDRDMTESPEVQDPGYAHEDEPKEEAEEERREVARVRSQQHQQVAEHLAHLSPPSARVR